MRGLDVSAWALVAAIAAAPLDLGVGPRGDIYVADPASGSIRRFGPAGEFLRQWGARGGSSRPFVALSGVVCDAAGNVYALDAGTARIQKFTPAGAFVAEWPVAPPRGTAGALRLARDPSGSFLQVIETASGRVTRYTLDGREVAPRAMDARPAVPAAEGRTWGEIRHRYR